jgi:hypothetical protein
VSNGTSPWFATFARRVVAGLCVSVAVAAASLLPANGVASASTLKRSAFCAAEAYIASNALGGNISPSEEWKTVAQEKTTIATLDRDLKRAVKDAPTKAFAKVAEPLEGTFSLVLDSPRLTKEVFKFETSTSGARSLNAPKLLARMTLMGEVTQSGDYVWAVNAACPDMTILNNDRDPFGNPPKFEATPTEVKATDEARSTMWESETPTKASFNPPTVASLRAAVARVNSCLLASRSCQGEHGMPCIASQQTVRGSLYFSHFPTPSTASRRSKARVFLMLWRSPVRNEPRLERSFRTPGRRIPAGHCPVGTPR